VAAGRLGRKAGRGIYAYSNGRPEADPALETLRAEVEAATGQPARTRFCVERLIVPLVNEAIACLAGQVATAREIDLAMTETVGMPQGPLAYYRRLGRAPYLALLDTLGAEFGPRFALRPDLLRRLEDPGLAAPAAA
jgi:3-hydroxybutyryl-CoA dehydrogenase